MIKPFKELYDLDISSFINKKPIFKWDKAQSRVVPTGDHLDYLNWAICLSLLYENGANQVRFGNICGPNGHSVFLALDNLPEVHVFVDIDGDRREITYPVIDGSTDIKMDKIAQSDIHNASQRAMVKCVAENWGLGLKLWVKEEAAPKIPQQPVNAESVYDRLKRKLNTCVNKLGSEKALEDRTDISISAMKKLLATCKQIAELESTLDVILE